MNSGDLTKRPRILVLTSTFPRWLGDQEPRFVYDLCQRLAARFDIDILAPHWPGAAERECMGPLQVFRYRYAPACWEIVAGGNGGILNRVRARPLLALLLPLLLLGQWLALRRLLHIHHYQWIHAHWILPQGLLAVLAGIGQASHPPILCTSHGGDLYGLRGTLMERLKCKVLLRCQAVSVVSHAMAKQVQRRCALAKVAVIPMGTDLEETFTSASGVPRKPTSLLFVGRLVEKKGLEHLLRALAKVRIQYPTIELLVAGQGPEETRLRQLSTELGLDGTICFLGSVAHCELPALFRIATLAVFPFQVARSGDQEGLGLVIVEAMGCGCPVIAGEVEAVRDLIRNDETGLLIEPGNAAVLAEKINLLLAAPRQRERLARNAERFVKEYFDWSRTVDAFVHLFQRPPL